MTEINPYASTTEVTLDPPESPPITTRRLWTGYLIAPAVPPLLMTIVFVGFGIIALQLAGPNATGTPAGILMFPVVMLTAGMLFSYVAALVLGMPIIFWLYRRKRLTGVTIHLTTVIVSFLFTVLMTILAAAADNDVTASDAASAVFGGTLVLSLFCLPSGTIYWWVTCRKRRFTPPA